MKKLLYVVSFFFIFLTVSLQADAQLFKKLADKVSENINDKNTGDASSKGTEEAARANESETLHSLPENYELSLAGSGPDLYLEYTMQMEGDKSSDYQMDMHMKMIASPSTGLGRSEMVMEIPMLGNMSMVTLTDAKNPTQIILLNERKKQYSVLDLSAVDKSGSTETFTVTRLGEVELHGLHCIHSKATNQDGHAFEIWTTKEIPGYEKMVELYSKTQTTGSGDLWKKLQAANAAGFMVKLKVVTKEGTSVMELTKIKNTDVPASLFKIPPGYDKKEGGWAKRYMKR